MTSAVRIPTEEAFGWAVKAYQVGRLAEAERVCHAILAGRPDLRDVRRLLAMIQARLGRRDEALASYEQVLALRPDDAVALNNRGNLLRSLGRLEEALASYERALAARPDYAEALNNRGAVLGELRRFEEALASCERALAVWPDYAAALDNCGRILEKLQRYEEALATQERVLALRPDDAAALGHYANILRTLGRLEEALVSYDKVVALKPYSADAFYNRGVVLGELQRLEEALASYDRALELEPNHAAALTNRRSVRGQLQKLLRFEEALATYQRALELDPSHAAALTNSGDVHGELQRLEEALASHDRALALRPDDVAALSDRGHVLRALNRLDEALASYEKVLAVQPNHVLALKSRGDVLGELQRFEEALASYQQVIALDPDHEQVLGGLTDCASRICDWSRRERLCGQLRQHVAEQKSIIPPFLFLGYSGDESLQLQCARNYVQDNIAVRPQSLWRGAIWRNDRVRLAYISSDFANYAMAHLISELLELHDRSAFEVIGISLGPDDRSQARARLVAAFDRFFDVMTWSDHDVARLLSGLRVDIAVCHSRGPRRGILAFRPAPIQVSYLGFPGTTGADFIDYILADPIVLPFDRQPYYSEQIVHLPDCYQVNDRKRPIAARTPSRAQLGLPADAFVFCCFNNNWKITPTVFDVWMRLLQAVEGSVLWLLRDNGKAEENLRKEAAARGVDATRLVFARRIKLEHHLARHRVADLFLDTLPYNAHTTASDALWVGLPLLTCQGEAFAGRVAGSLLKAIGLPELVTHNFAEYEALALRLAREPELLRAYRNRLAENRLRQPLFDTDRYRCHIEAAYLYMWELWQRGEKPKSFAVPTEPARCARLEHAAVPRGVHLGD